MIVPGFPHAVGGTKKYQSGTVGASGDAAVDAQWSIARLAQRCEEELRELLRATHSSPEDIGAMVKQVAGLPAVQPFLDQIHAVRLIGDILEVEFSATGYPDRYASYVGVDGTGGRYKLRKIGRPIPVVSSRFVWSRSELGTACTAEARDEAGRTLCRIRVFIEQLDQGELAPYHGDGGIPMVEESAMSTVRAMALEQRG